MKKLIYQIKTESNNLSLKTDEELNLQISSVKKRSKKESLESLIVEWFALTQEISFRKIGLKHFETQLLAGIFLHQGKIVEMKTGEGKTLASTLPVALNALTEKGVHVVTVNEYLAERDYKSMGKIYTALGLTVGLVKSTSSLIEKQKSYQSDITYVTNSELVFDYLRDSSSFTLNEIVQRPFSYCVIDEIDSILVDEARTPLILSTVKENSNLNKLYLAKAIANFLQKDVHFQIDEKRREINLTEKGYKQAAEKVGKKSLYDPDDPWILDLLNALKAKYIFKLNKDYIVLNNKIVIVDEFTGRIMEDRRWSMGLHESIEIKEEVQLGGGTKTKSSITYQNFFTLYPKLSGMTGTAKTTEIEFRDIYNLEVVVLPTYKPMIRKDLPDLVYQTELAKWKAVLTQSKSCFEVGQPLLIGTASVEKSDFLSDLFTLSKIPHQVLNAKPENVRRESEIIAQAGERYAITIATNMAGRGTDIILGGNPIFKVKQKLYQLLIEQKLDPEDSTNFSQYIFDINNTYQNSFSILETDIKNLPYSLETSHHSLKEFYDFIYKSFYSNWEKENLIVKSLGGLFVLGTERHETRRIDNQLRGRAGRQGDPGISQFFVSLEDELLKAFGGESIKKWVEFLVQEKELPLESDLLTKSLENAQKKIEFYNYDLRKNVFQYDDILNSQRKQLFGARYTFLSKNFYEEFFLRYTEASFDQDLSSALSLDASSNNNNPNLWANYDSYFLYSQMFSDFQNTNKNFLISKNKKEFYKEIWITLDLRFSQTNFYQLGFLKNNRSTIILSLIDFYWTEHLERMSYIRETINLRSYGQQNPLVEYNSEAFKSFKLMFEQIRSSMIYYFLNNPIYY